MLPPSERANTKITHHTVANSPKTKHPVLLFLGHRFFITFALVLLYHGLVIFWTWHVTHAERARSLTEQFLQFQPPFYIPPSFTTEPLVFNPNPCSCFLYAQTFR